MNGSADSVQWEGPPEWAFLGGLVPRRWRGVLARFSED
jgi:hypothetical protein